jgi:hypothetical protein
LLSLKGGKRRRAWLWRAACVFLLALSAGGCSVVRTLAGADFDAEQLDKAREAAMMQVRADGAKQLAARLSRTDRVDDADIVVVFGQRFVQRAAQQLVGARGWLDPATSYVIDSVMMSLRPGAAIATLRLRAHQDTYGVDVDMMLDCIMSYRTMGRELLCVLEPYHIAPAVSTGALLSGVKDVIRDVITIRVASLSRDIPPMKFPLDITSQYAVEGGTVAVRNGINLDLFSPRRLVECELTIKDALIMEDAFVLGLNVKRAEVK